MTETQAKSGAPETSTTPVEEEAADANAAATGRAAVGRAAVPGEAPSPKFTRAPGMTPPPDQPPAEDGSGKSEDAKKATAGKSPIATAAQAVSGSQTGGAGAQDGSGGGSDGSGPDGSRPAATGPGRTSIGAASVRTVGQSRPAVGAARVTEAVRAARSTVASAAARGPRRARLNIKRIDPWSVMKFSFAVSLVLFVVVIVATSVLYLALDAMGVFASINGSLTDLISAGGGGGGGFKITAKGVIGTATLVGLVNVVLFTALATLGAFIYNVCADLVGGIELTLAERD